MERRGDFPSRIQVSPQAVGWLESEVDHWIASRARGIPAAHANIAAA
jgi:predicted DNA-binding transcriptional regulator AlpA